MTSGRAATQGHITARRSLLGRSLVALIKLTVKYMAVLHSISLFNSQLATLKLELRVGIESTTHRDKRGSDDGIMPGL